MLATLNQNLLKTTNLGHAMAFLHLFVIRRVLTNNGFGGIIKKCNINQINFSLGEFDQVNKIKQLIMIKVIIIGR